MAMIAITSDLDKLARKYGRFRYGVALKDSQP